MKRSVFSPASLLVLLICLILIMSGASVGAEEPEVPIEDQSGWFGVYVGGEKVGFANWSIEKKTAGKREYYRVSLTEERTKEVREKEVKNTYEFNGTMSLSLVPKSLDYTEKASGRVTTVKGKVSGKNVNMTVAFGGKPLPSKKITLKPGTSWEFCGPLAWAWKSLSYDKVQVYNRILEKASTFKSSKLKGAEKKITFEGKEVDAIVWGDEENSVSITTDGAGKLFTHSTFSKKGVETKYVAESEDLARSSMNFEQFVAKKKKKPGKKKGTNKGGGDSPFENALDPVDDDAEPSNKGEYLKLKVDPNSETYISIRAAEGWICTPVKIQNNNFFVVVNKDDNNVFMMLFPSQSNGDDPDVIIENIIGQLEEGGNVQNIKYLNEEEISVFEQGDTEFAYTKVSMIIQNAKSIGYFISAPGETVDLTFRCIIPASQEDDYNDDILSMFGSLRLQEE